MPPVHGMLRLANSLSSHFGRVVQRTLDSNGGGAEHRSRISCSILARVETDMGGTVCAPGLEAHARAASVGVELFWKRSNAEVEDARISDIIQHHDLR